MMNSRERSEQLMQHLDRVRQEQPSTPDYWFATSYQLLDDNGKGVDAFMLEAFKSWHEVGEVHQISVVLDMVEGENQGAQRLDLAAERLNALQQTDGLQTAMNEAEKLAVQSGWLDVEREDGRLFDAGPDDPFITQRELERAVENQRDVYREWLQETQQQREANNHLEGAAWFEATFENDSRELLEPLHDTVNYAVVVDDVDPHTVALAVEKYWKEPTGELGTATLTLATYDAELGREKAESERELLLALYDERGLDGLMHRAELTAMENGRPDTLQLFHDGPPDRFETLAQSLGEEPNPYWNTDGEKIEPLNLTAEIPDWHLDALPVQTPEGEPLGHALFCVREGEQGTQMLEMAHFKDEKTAAAFEKDFRWYLIPGIVDGPELAEAVAQLEGFSAQWQPLEGQDLANYRESSLTLTHTPSDWQLYNPNAEREAQIAAENPGMELDL